MVEVYLISGYVIAILMMSVTLMALLYYAIKLQISRERKDEIIIDKDKKIEDLQSTIDDMSEEGMELSNRADRLNVYYEMANEHLKNLASYYFIYKDTGIDNILRHRYFGDDPVIQHFITSTLKFDKDFKVELDKYNKQVGEIFENE